MRNKIQLLGCKIYRGPSESGVLPETLCNFVLKNHEISNWERAHGQHGTEHGAEVRDGVPSKPAHLRSVVQCHAETRAPIPKAAKPCEHSGSHKAPRQGSCAAPRYRHMPSPTKEVGSMALQEVPIRSLKQMWWPRLCSLAVENK